MPEAKGRQDDELTTLLTLLYTIQEDIGAKPASTEEDKRARAENVAVMGKGKKAAAKGSRFLELKSTIVDRLKNVHQLLKDVKEKESAGYGGDNAKEVIKMQAEIREQIRVASEEWNEMDTIYKKEARKKKSKFTVEELEIQSELVRRLQVEIEKVKDAHMRGYAKKGGGNNAEGNMIGSSILNSNKLYNDGGNNNVPSWGGTGGGVALTDNQKQQIMQIEERDADFDRQLDEIGEGIQDLAEIAALQGEEVERQAALLATVHTKIDLATERMTKVNTRMKETLEEVGRSGDKLCVDIMCVVLMIGFIAVIYSFIK